MRLVIEPVEDIDQVLQFFNSRTLKGLLMKVSEVAPALNTLSEQLRKSHIEILAKIEEVKNLDVPPEAVQALEELAALVQAQDDIVPDAPPPEEPTV